LTKSPNQFPKGVAPLYLVRGEGSHVWDVDGNEYIDFVNSLATINLGHGDPDVCEAVLQQLKLGVIFSLPHPIETQLAEALRDIVPCAEMSRFGKNGSDVTSAAIRLARAHTGRDHVIACGYHGWQDWYIGSTSWNKGVPCAVQELTHLVPFNDLAAVDRAFRAYSDDVAAVILEPMSTTFPVNDYLSELKELTHRHGALLIFDEMVTGFRLARGGAQARFGVTPDIATFGKAMANGFPVSAICGSANVMSTMEEVFFSLTYGGETLSLAAALATIRKIRAEPVIETMHEQGVKIERGFHNLVNKHGIAHIVGLSGDPAWTFIAFKDAGGYSQWSIKTLFLQELFARGVLSLGLHLLSYRHSDEELSKLLGAYDEIFPMLRKAVDDKELTAMLRTEPLEPQFKLRT